ncbi:MAG: FRG domain-containing protein [Nitrosomonas ureae]
MKNCQIIKVTDALEAIYLLLELRCHSFFSFRGQRNSLWPLGINHKIPSSWWDELKEDELRERDTNEIMYNLELRALTSKKTDEEAYWKSKSARRILTKNLKQFTKNSQLFKDNSLIANQILQHENDEIKSKQWWYDLIFAHHYGLRTMLLDWTTNPLVALYFAVENAVTKLSVEGAVGNAVPKPPKEIRGAVFALKVRGKPSQSGIPEKRWHNFDEATKNFLYGEFCPFWIMINPPLNTDRIARQSGKFSYHPSINDRYLIDDNGLTPEQGLYDDEELYKIIIGDSEHDPSDDIRRLLGIMNIHRASLFPDHDGVASYINYEWHEIADDGPEKLPKNSHLQSNLINSIRAKYLS